MANPIFQMLMGQQSNPLQMLMSQQNRNPIEMLANKGIEIPEENRGSSKDMVQYLLNNGTMDRGAFNQIYQKLQMMGFKF